MNNNFISKLKRIDLNFIVYLFIIFISFILGVALPSSPFSTDNLPIMDSSVFYYIGESLYREGILYLDATDQKGPVIFFINLLAISIYRENYLGLWILEVIAYILFLIPIYKISNLLNIRKIFFCISSVLITISLPFLLDASGNAVEFWSLPFMSLSFYIFCLYYFKNKKIKFLNFLLVGVCCSISMLLRFNQVGIWLGFSIITIVVFLKNKEYFNLLKLGLYFVLGIIIGLIPFITYHLLTNSLLEAIDQSILFNLEYVKTTYISSKYDLMLQFIKIFLKNNFFIIFLMYFFVLFIDYIKYKKLKHISFHLSVILSIIIDIYNITFNSRLYNHYFILLYPALLFCCIFTIQYIYIYIYIEL